MSRGRLHSRTDLGSTLNTTWGAYNTPHILMDLMRGEKRQARTSSKRGNNRGSKCLFKYVTRKVCQERYIKQLPKVHSKEI